MKHIFILNILLKSHLIKHSGTGRAFKDTQRALQRLRHSESTQALGHSESTQRVHGGHTEGTRTLGHSKTYGTRALAGHLGTWRALGYLRHSCT